MNPQEAPPVERNAVPMVEYKPFDDFATRISQWLQRFQAPAPMQFDARSLQELWRQRQQPEQQANAQEQLMQEMQAAQNEAQAYKSMQQYGQLPGV